MGRRALLPLGILAIGALAVAAMFWLRPGVPLAPPDPVAPLVRAETIRTRPFRFVVEGHGTVAPRTESDLVAQVEGEVTWISPAFVPGGFFAEGDPLVRIEAADYEADVQTARARLSRARSEFDRAKKERERQRRLMDQSIASQARIDDAENAYSVALANVREAEAMLGQAQRDLERTEIRAPYDGRVREKNADVGQFVGRGASLGGVYAVDYAEVRVPVPDRELSYLDLPLGYRGGSPNLDDGPEVRLRADFAGEPHSWAGRVVRTEGEIDPRSRTVNVVARVEDPYGRHQSGEVVPLKVGLFVEAQILGRRIDHAVVLPRVALQRGERVLVIDDESRLHFRDVEVLRVEREEVVIGGGLASGERVVVSPLPAAVDGMSVRVLEEAAPGLARAQP